MRPTRRACTARQSLLQAARRAASQLRSGEARARMALRQSRAHFRPASRRRWWAHLVGALRIHPHKHDANFPPKKDRGFARGGRVYRGLTFALSRSRIHGSINARSLNALGSNARVVTSPCGETDVTCGDSRKRFDHELFLSCPHAGLEIIDGVTPKHRNFALTHDRAGVVLGINEMNRNARLRLTGLKHRLEHTIPVHPTPTESRQECRVSVESSPLESSQDEGPQFLHVTGQKNDVDCSRKQHISNRRV